MVILVFRGFAKEVVGRAHEGRFPGLKEGSDCTYRFQLGLSPIIVSPFLRLMVGSSHKDRRRSRFQDKVCCIIGDQEEV